MGEPVGLWLRCRVGMWRARCRSRWASHVMQKPCKNHAKCGAYGAPTRRTFTLPPGPCYMCCMCFISQGKPLNIHSPRVPCYMYKMCCMALYSTYTTDFARTECIAHIVHKARSRGGSAAWRVRYSTYSTYSKDPGESGVGGSAAWRVRYSTYSTYSMDPAESGGSAAWRAARRGRVAQRQAV